jgi:aspartyl-tRNA(Asn)/glutamyl-tRNA(Gln) amidotransferase subunit A
MTELHELTIADARDLLAQGEITALELTQACLDRIVAVDNQVRAFLAIDDESALEQARAADEGRTTKDERQNCRPSSFVGYISERFAHKVDATG